MTLYSTGCPKCNILEKKLDHLGIEYRICDDVDTMLEHGFTSVPVLYDDDSDQYMNFEDAYRFVSSLGSKKEG